MVYLGLRENEYNFAAAVLGSQLRSKAPKIHAVCVVFICSVIATVLVHVALLSVCA